MATAEEDGAFSLGYDQAVEVVMTEVAAWSPTAYSGIMNKYPAWKEIIAGMRDREGRQGRLAI